MIEKIRNIAWIVGVVFTLCVFVQSLIMLQPRVTKLEERLGDCDAKYTRVESRVSGIEIKLDAIYQAQQEQGKDIKDIYHLILERHK